MKRITSKTLICAGLCGIVLLQACNQKTAKSYEAADPLVKNIDTTVRPSDDFFNYANGGWIKKNPIPAAYSGWGIGSEVQEELRLRLRKINEDALKEKAEQGSNSQKIGDFYYTAMDSAKAERESLAPLKAELQRIDAINDINSLLNAFAHFNTIGVTTPVGPYVGQDDKNSEKMMLQLYQTGIGMPNRDYYFNTDEQSVKVRNDYRQNHLPALFILAGLSKAEAVKAADKVYAMEKFLADSSRKLVDLRDPYANYNKMTVDALAKLAPGLNWKSLFENMHYKNVDTVIVGQPEYYRAVNKAIQSYSPDDWKLYLRKNLISEYSPYLSQALVDENFRFYGKVMSGRTEQLPRWKRALDAENSLMGEVLGQLFVKEYFPAKTKQRYVSMVNAVRESFKDRIKNLDWMSEQTKLKAYQKLDKINPKVGYPDKWKDFSQLDIKRDSYALNILRGNIFHHKRNADKLGKPVDRSEWGMTPQTYNAYYNPSNNEIVLPAAQLMIPGVKDEDLDDAVVYGYAAASTIGHEITHGFDDTGRQYDAQGNLKAWWTPQDSARFTQKAQMLVDQFNKYKVHGLAINGKATLGENIADLGGIVIGLDAFKKTEQYKKGEKINGFTPLQRFFLGYSLGWLGHYRKETLINRVLTDEHSPGFLRVNGPFSDVPEFYEAFNIKKGDKMWIDPDKRVQIW